MDKGRAAASTPRAPGRRQTVLDPVPPGGMEPRTITAAGAAAATRRTAGCPGNVTSGRRAPKGIKGGANGASVVRFPAKRRGCNFSGDTTSGTMRIDHLSIWMLKTARHAGPRPLLLGYVDRPLREERAADEEPEAGPPSFWGFDQRNRTPSGGRVGRSGRAPFGRGCSVMRTALGLVVLLLALGGAGGVEADVPWRGPCGEAVLRYCGEAGPW